MKNYETFFEDLWDEVSPQLVSDDIWYKDEPKFQELTFEHPLQERLFLCYQIEYLQEL